MDANVPDPVFDLSLALMSGSDQERHPENVKSDFITTFHEAIDLPGKWGVGIQSVTYSNDLVNYEGEGRTNGSFESMDTSDGIEETIDYAADSVGGLRTPWLDENGWTRTRMPVELPEVEVKIEMTMMQKKADGSWYTASYVEEMIIDLKRGENGHYDRTRLIRDVQRGMRNNRFYAIMPCIPDPCSYACSRFNLMNAYGESVMEPVLLEPALNKWPNFKTMFNEYLCKLVESSTDQSMLLSLSGTDRILFFGPIGCSFSITRGKKHVLSEYRTMCRYFGFGEAVRETPVAKIRPNSNSSQGDGNFLWMGVMPINMDENKNIPIGHNPFNYTSVSSICVRVEKFDVMDKMMMDSMRQYVIGIDSMYMCRNMHHLMDVIFGAKLNIATGGAVSASLTEGRIKLTAQTLINGNEVGMGSGIHSYKLTFTSACNGYVNRMLGAAPSALVFSGMKYSPDVSTELTIHVNPVYTFPHRPQIKFSKMQTMRDYVTAEEHPSRKDAISFRMLNGGIMHGFAAIVLIGQCISGTGACVSIKCTENRHDTWMPLSLSNPSQYDIDGRLLGGMFPESDSASLNLLTLDDLKDTRDKRRSDNASLYVMGYRRRAHKREAWDEYREREYAMQDKGKIGYVKELELAGILGGQAAYKRPELLLAAIKQCIRIALVNMEDKWRMTRISDNKELKVDDVFCIEWLEAEKRFQFTCGNAFDYMEVALSPGLAHLCGFDNEDVLLRLKCSNSGDKTIVPVDTIRNRQGVRWLDDITHGGMYEMHTRISGPYPVSLSLGVNNIFVHLDIIGDTEYVGSHRTNVIGVVPINWKEEGNDVHVPIHQKYVRVMTDRLSQIRVQLHDFKGDRIKFMSNNGATVIVVLNLKRMG